MNLTVLELLIEGRRNTISETHIFIYHFHQEMRTQKRDGTETCYQNLAVLVVCPQMSQVPLTVAKDKK